MKYIPILTVLILFRLSTASAQSKTELLSFENLGGSGYDVLSKLTPTIDGGFLASIGTNSNSGKLDFSCSRSQRIIYRKYDVNGLYTNQWCKIHRYEGVGHKAFLLSSGNILYLTQMDHNRYSGRQRLLIERETITGNQLLRKEMGPEKDICVINDMIALTDGNFLIATTVRVPGGDVIYTLADTGKRSNNIWLTKIDTNAKLIWQKIIGGSNVEWFTHLAQAPDNGYYVAALSRSSDWDCKCGGVNTELFISRLDSVGNILWSRCLGSGEKDVILGNIVEDGTGGVYIAATARGNGKDLQGVHIGKEDFWIVHLDKNNNLKLSKCYGSAGGIEYAYGIAVSKDRTIWVCGGARKDNGEPHGKDGMIDTGYGATDAWVINIDSTGKLLYSKILGTTNGDNALDIYALRDSSVVVTGMYSSPQAGGNFPNTYEGGIYDAFIARFGIPKPSSVPERRSGLYNLQIHPNPVSGELNITNTTQLDNRIHVSDINGRAVLDKIIKLGTIQIDVQHWPPGVYILKSSDENGHQSFHKFTKL